MKRPQERDWKERGRDRWSEKGRDGPPRFLTIDRFPNVFIKNMHIHEP